MVTGTRRSRLELNLSRDPSQIDGAWWPESRHLGDQLATLFALWPPKAGRIARVLYSPPDWDDRPHAVLVGSRVVKTGCFPRDDTQCLVLTMSNGDELTLRIIAPASSQAEAIRVLDEIAADTPDPVALRVVLDGLGLRDWHDEGDLRAWDNEGGHP
ncbi:hypothetical protein GCM10009668_20480 [Nocardioides dubius]|uniref:Uncharacterized protein n=1 Tax=Nocardioides dubius TaxID=317019 RepID=A0ABP4EBJ2_9ACTN